MSAAGGADALPFGVGVLDRHGPMQSITFARLSATFTVLLDKCLEWIDEACGKGKQDFTEWDLLAYEPMGEAPLSCTAQLFQPLRLALVNIPQYKPERQSLMNATLQVMADFATRVCELARTPAPHTPTAPLPSSLLNPSALSARRSSRRQTARAAST